MRIYVEYIDEELTHQGVQTGHRIRFRSELTSGIALLVAGHSVGPGLHGREICVEVEADSFQDLRVLLAEAPHSYSLMALPQEGCYAAVGQVNYAPPRENDDYPIIGVCVADAWFHWTPDVTGRQRLSVGDWIGFTVVGLVLWDTNT
jgi:hypothetical protein